MTHYPISFPGLGITVDPDPVAFTVFGKDIYWYGILITLGFVLGVVYALWRAKKDGLDDDKVFDVIFYTLPFAIICARLYYVIFELPDYHSFMDVISIWKGGVAIYGGIIGAVLFGTLFCRLKKVPIFQMLDVISIPFMIGQCIGRWGNFVNREAHGGLTDLPWRMEIMEGGRMVAVHPTFFYESFWNFIGILLLHRYYPKKKFNGEVFLMYAVWYGAGRFVIEGMRTDSLYLPGTAIRVSQVVAILCVIGGLIGIWWGRKHCQKQMEEMETALEENKEAPIEVGENTMTFTQEQLEEIKREEQENHGDPNGR
jgi:phosphatidylglycerol:prolipoprotein diacylglycerol transferase